MSLPSGTDISNLKIGLVSAADLCKIISTCARANVRALKLLDIEIQFGPIDQSIPNQNNSLVETKLVEQATQILVEEESRQRSFEQLQQDVEELKLTDPLAFEQLIGGESEVGST